MKDADRTIRLTAPGGAPWSSRVFTYGPMLPFAAGTAAAWWLRDDLGDAILYLTLLWACAILMFLSGVRHGVGGRTEGGPTFVVIATTLGLFGLGFLALVMAALGQSVPALVLLIGGFTGVAILDPVTARRGEAPPFLRPLPPLQIPIAILSLVGLLALKL
ncbi:DUF3429 domain-containing protein [Methylobacterium sp. BTF04]|uniref:DUF3429 domain-containing protein n=1 Tax=Methylobacterium sp. BTF04 TaxID=2708300 RepID=UPI0013D88A8E|nr:DUF3429 domain-containing protein [Methylobacterium sp. BTF04]NEU10733.1 DUF3429 domain-containing protein [Methylobacterium sp. BTF04]